MVQLSPRGQRRLVMVAIAVMLLYAGFETGRSRAGYSALSALMEKQLLKSRVGELARSNQQLQERLAADEITHKVDEESRAETQAMIGELQAELARQQQELDFYRGLVAEKFGTGTVKLQQLSALPQGPDQYLMRVTLVHSGTRNLSARGSLTLTVIGSRAGSLSRLSLGQIAGDGRDRVDFSLRYFTTVEVLLRFPKGFAPASVELEFKADRNGPDPVKQTFPWSGVLEADAAGSLTPEEQAD